MTVTCKESLVLILPRANLMMIQMQCGVFQWKLVSLLTPVVTQIHRARGSGLVPWPAHLTTPPPRLADLGYSDKMFVLKELWQRRVENYWNLLDQHIESDTLRNLMDTKGNLGSFAAALNDKNVWVMNVVPEDGANTLKIIYDRGLIGTVHNWCESFSTYPRTYDLLHAWTVFTDIGGKGCSIVDSLIEMDLILRPIGFIIVHDKRSIVELIKKYLGALHWESVSTAESPRTPSKMRMMQCS